MQQELLWPQVGVSKASKQPSWGPGNRTRKLDQVMDLVILLNPGSSLT